MNDYDGIWSYGFKVGTMTRAKLERSANQDNKKIDFRCPLTSEIEDGYQVLTFGYWNE